MSNKNEDKNKKGKPKGWRYFLIVGLITGVAGILAFSLPILAGETIATMLGILLLVVGVFQILRIFYTEDWQERFWHGLSAIVYAVGGAFVIIKPLDGLLDVTVLIAIIIGLNAVSRIVSGLKTWHLVSSKLLFLSGVISVLIGFYFFSSYGTLAFDLTVLGIFAGVSLLFEGLSFMYAGWKMKNKEDEDEDEDEDEEDQ